MKFPRWFTVASRVVMFTAAITVTTGAVLELSARQRARQEWRMPGKLVDVGGVVTYTRMFGTEVRALVLIDGSHPKQFTRYRERGPLTHHPFRRQQDAVPPDPTLATCRPGRA